MTSDDRLLSGATSESSLNPNKSSGDIGERTWTPEQFWEFAAAFLGDHEATTSRTMIEDSGLVLIPAAEIERLRLGYRAIMEGLIAGRVGGDDVVWYDNIETLFDFCDVMINGNEPRQFHELKSLEDRALTAESAVAAAYENAAKIAEAKALEFLSPEYATGQPLSSFNERFACEQVASAIRAAVSKKTAESGHSPSTLNAETE